MEVMFSCCQPVIEKGNQWHCTLSSTQIEYTIFPFTSFLFCFFFLYASTNVKKIRASGLSQTLSCMKNIQLNSLVTSVIPPMSYTTLPAIPTIKRTPTSSCVLCTLETNWKGTPHSSTGHWGSNQQMDDSRLDVTCTIRDCTHVLI